VYLPPLKSRHIDPHYYDAQGLKRRLSEQVVYHQILQGQTQLMQQAYVARVHMAPTARSLLRDSFARNHSDWASASERPRLLTTDPEAFARLIAQTALTNHHTLLGHMHIRL